MSTINEHGIVEFDDDEALELLFRGFEIGDIALINAAQFNTEAEKWDKPKERCFEDHEQSTISERANQWLFDLPEIDVRAELISRCKSQDEIDRTNMEMDLYEERKLLPVLRLMFYLVDHFRKNKIIWGVGRGSSVSSFVLYLIGIHKIDSLKYDLSIKDFLKD